MNSNSYREKSRVLDQTFDIDNLSLEGLKVGILEEFLVEEIDERNKGIQKAVLDLLEQHGAEIKVVSVPLVKYVLPYHYSLIPSEAASNLARYDGIRYGF